MNSRHAVIVRPTSLPGVVTLVPPLFKDRRGSFSEIYSAMALAAVGIHDVFVQENQTCSYKNVLRGLHYQIRKPQAKLCRAVVGELLDVAVDVRPGSSTFGQWTSALLSEFNQTQLYVPVGFAHGVLALTDGAVFAYKSSEFYDPADQHGILWNDKDLAINWGIETPILSDIDNKLPTLRGKA